MFTAKERFIINLKWIKSKIKTFLKPMFYQLKMLKLSIEKLLLTLGSKIIEFRNNVICGSIIRFQKKIIKLEHDLKVLGKIKKMME